MTRHIRYIRFPGPWLVASLLIFPIAVARAAERVDLLLAFAADVSRSMDVSKFKLQRDGYVAGINNPRVVNAIRSGGTGRIAACFIEWSGDASQKLVIDWTMISDAQSARRFSDGIVEAPRSFARSRLSRRRTRAPICRRGRVIQAVAPRISLCYRW